MRRNVSFLTVVLLLLLALSGRAWGEGFFEKESTSQRLSWIPLDLQEVVVSAFPEEVPIQEIYRIEINVPERQLYLLAGDQVLKTYPVAVGSARYRTPIGPRYLTDVTWNPWWFPPPYADWAKGAKPAPPGPGNPLGPVKMSLGGDIRLHGTNAESSVGRPVSHGCMRMRNRDARELAWFFQSLFSDQTDLELLETYKRFRGQSFVVKLNQRIPVAIVYDRVSLRNKEIEIHPDIYGLGRTIDEEVLNKLSMIGIQPWEVDPFNLEGLRQASGSFRVKITDLL